MADAQRALRFACSPPHERPRFSFTSVLAFSIGYGGGPLFRDSTSNPNGSFEPTFWLRAMPLPCMQEYEEAGVLALPACNTKSRYMKRSRRKAARAPSVASSSLRSAKAGFRLRGAFLAGRRGRPSTPVPLWKVHEGGRMPLSSRKQQGHHTHGPSKGNNLHNHDRLHYPSVSARKLAASLWELQEPPCSRAGANKPQKGLHPQRPQYVDDHANSPSFHHVLSLSPSSSSESHFQVSMQSEHPRHADSIDRGRIHGGTLMAEVCVAGNSSRYLGCSMEDISTKPGSSGPMTTKGLVKVLNHLWSLEERHARSLSLVEALRGELDQARAQLQELLLKDKEHSKEVECVTKKMEEGRVFWQEEHEKSARAFFLATSQELENERRAKQKLEVACKKVEKELRDARRKLGKALQELEKEVKARELMEDVCDELAREVGEDKARVEELRRESLKVREEVEEERKMLQLAEIWREERVQMKLTEAKVELEEKNTALDKLRSEMEILLKAKRGDDTREESQHTYMHSRDASSGQSFADMPPSNTQRNLASGRKSVDSATRSASRVIPEGYGFEDDDDLHSIELNKESFMIPGSAQSGSYPFQQRVPLLKGRKSVDQKSCAAPTMHRQMSERSTGKLQVFDWRRNDQASEGGKDEVGVERDGLYDYAQVSQWVESSLKGGRMKDWGILQEEAVQRGREECVKSWHKGNGRSHELVSLSPKATRMHANHQVESVKPRGWKSGPLNNECKESLFSRNQSDWLQRVFDFERVHTNSICDDGHEGLKLIPSPTRQWANP